MEGERLGKIQDPREWKGKEEEEDRDCDRGKGAWERTGEKSKR